jgi:PAS domain-containing protein
MAWLLAVICLIAGEQQWLARSSGAGRQTTTSSGIFSWLVSAAFSMAAMDLVLFHTGEEQTFGVTLYGVIMFQILVKHYADPRRLTLNLIPPVLTMAIVQMTAAWSRIAQGHPLKVITLLASPVIVFWVFRSVQINLSQNRARLAEAATRAETSARQIQEAHRIALLAEELAGIGNWRLDVPTGVSTWSEGVYRVYGLDPSNGVPSLETLLKSYEPEHRAEALSHFSNLLGNGAPFTFEACIKGDDGQIRHISANGAAERGGTGEVTTLFGTIMDVTQARLREQALHESELRYRLLTERATDVIVRYDQTGQIEFVSPSVRQFGYAPKTSLAATWPSSLTRMIRPKR